MTIMVFFGSLKIFSHDEGEIVKSKYYFFSYDSYSGSSTADFPIAKYTLVMRTTIHLIVKLAVRPVLADFHVETFDLLHLFFDL